MFNTIKTLFKKAKKDLISPELKIDTAIDKNNSEIQKMKSRVIQLEREKYANEKTLKEAEIKLRNFEKEMVTAINSNQSEAIQRAIAMNIREQEKMIERLKEVIALANDQYLKALDTIRKFQEANNVIKISKEAVLTRLNIAKIKKSMLDFEVGKIAGLEEVEQLADEQEFEVKATEKVEKDLGNIKETNTQSSEYDDIISRYKKA